MDEEILRYKEKLESQMADKPIWEKKCLTIDETAEYSGIGKILLRKLTTAKNCPFIVSASNQVLVVREKFDKYISSQKHLNGR